MRWASATTWHCGANDDCDEETRKGEEDANRIKVRQGFVEETNGKSWQLRLNDIDDKDMPWFSFKRRVCHSVHLEDEIS